MMLTGDWIGLIASDLLAEFRRRAERRRFPGAAWAQPRGSPGRRARPAGWHGRGRRLQAVRAWRQPGLRPQGSQPLRQGGERW
jgi:hypothetical protein